MDSSLRPQHRVDDLVLSAFDGELLIQDTRRHKAHALNGQAAAIFRLADGSRSIEEIAVLASAESGDTVTPEMVCYSVGLLQRLNLLEEQIVRSDDRVTRKVLLKRVGAAVALASIATIAVPAVGAHATGCAGQGQNCTATPCCTGVCSCSLRGFLCSCVP